MQRALSTTVRSMRFSSSVATACLALAPCSTAWQLARPATFSSRLFASAVVAEEEAKKSTAIADGVIQTISGNFYAVQVQDETSESTASGDLLGRAVTIGGADGVVVAHRPPLAYVYSEDASDSTNSVAKVMSQLAEVSIDPSARLFDALGRSSSAPSANDRRRAIFAPIPQVKDIALINHPVLTGITMMDALAPLGRGQNMLWIGSDAADLRRLATDLLQTQARRGTKCIYAALEDDSLDPFSPELLDEIQLVRPKDKTGDLTSRSAQAVTAAATACAIGETYALNGEHALVVVDTIDRHKQLWDATTRVLVDIFGVDSVVASDRSGGASSEMRAFYSSLIQRAGQYKKGGGSLTLVMLTHVPPVGDDEDETTREFSLDDFAGANDKIMARLKMLVDKKIPLTAKTLRKIEIPVPSASEGARRLVLQHVDDLISMSDGQIWFDDTVSQKPPMDPQRSITRVGIGADTESRADAPALRKIVEGVRLDLAQAASMDGAEQTNASRKQIARREALLLAMYQESGSGGRRLSESCVLLLAASEGKLDGVQAGSDEGKELTEKLLSYMNESIPEDMQSIDSTFDMDADTRGRLKKSIDDFFTQ